jgi:tetratricopeptide (TPR) repeat protein
VEEDKDQSSKSFAETSEKKIDEILDLVSDEDEIDLEQELLSSGPSKEESSQHTQIEKPRFEDKQQKMLVAGGHYYMQKKYEKAVSVFKRIVRKYPQNIEAFYNLGNSYFRLNEWEEARNAYEEACRLDPTFLDAIENLGVIHANQKNFKKAVDVWKRLLEYDPKRTDIKKKIEKALKLSKGI